MTEESLLSIRGDFRTPLGGDSRLRPLIRAAYPPVLDTTDWTRDEFPATLTGIRQFALVHLARLSNKTESFECRTYSIGTQVNSPQVVWDMWHLLASSFFGLSAWPVIFSGETESTSNWRVSLQYLVSFPPRTLRTGKAMLALDNPTHFAPFRRQSVRMYAPCLASARGIFTHSA